KRLWTDRAGGEKVVATQAYNEVEEAEFVADEIERLRKTEQRGYSDFAVLYRTNAQSRAFEDVLARRRIPYRLVGGVRFWERREVKDLVAYLRFAFNPRDALSFSRIVSVPPRKIGSVTVEAVGSFARDSEAEILTLLADPARVPGLPRAAVGPLQGLEDFLTEVALVSDVDAYDEEGEGVTLITLHMVKGLEFPVVFMVGMEEGLLPHQRALEQTEESIKVDLAANEMAEERRLCYV